jgi:hypothetical protein
LFWEDLWKNIFVLLLQLRKCCFVVIEGAIPAKQWGWLEKMVHFLNGIVESGNGMVASFLPRYFAGSTVCFVVVVLTAALFNLVRFLSSLYTGCPITHGIHCKKSGKTKCQFKKTDWRKKKVLKKLKYFILSKFNPKLSISGV